MTVPKLSKKEFLILELLIAKGELYGLELVRNSNNKLKRGTVYTSLRRMADKGYVESRQEKDPYVAGMPRRIYSASGYGARVFQENAQINPSGLEALNAW